MTASSVVLTSDLSDTVRGMLMISPYVRRHRLARELLNLRERAGLRTDQLAKLIGESRQKISRLENGHVRPNQDDIIKILDALDVTEQQWETITTIAREAAERGWWETYGNDIDPRQALYANLESGATSIREYPLTIVPGLLQTVDFIRALTEYDDLSLVVPKRPTPESVLRAREGRQRVLRRPGGPTYEVVVDELVLRRPSVPPAILAAQLRRLVEVDTGRVSVRVLPVDVEFANFSVPKSAFSVYTYRDPADPKVVAVDTVTTDLVLTDPAEVGPYDELYARLCGSALSVADSAELLTEAANDMEGVS